MSTFRTLAFGAAGLALAACTPAADKPVADAAPHVVAADDIAAGRYLVTIGGCNDCHTDGWAMTGGAVTEDKWLTGSPLGWQGPWGTTYASNLRLLASSIDEEAFVTMLHTRKDKPPMPWMNLNRMHEDDARAIYRYLKAQGPAGQAMPTALPPGEAPRTPYVVMVPPNMPAGL